MTRMAAVACPAPRDTPGIDTISDSRRYKGSNSTGKWKSSHKTSICLFSFRMRMIRVEGSVCYGWNPYWIAKKTTGLDPGELDPISKLRQAPARSPPSHASVPMERTVSPQITVQLSRITTSIQHSPSHPPKKISTNTTTVLQLHSHADPWGLLSSLLDAAGSSTCPAYGTTVHVASSTTR